MNTKPIAGPLAEEHKDATGAVLQASLVDLVDLALTGKQMHWNVVGRNFRSVHLQLDELVALARQYADAVAERAAAIGVSPDGRAATVAKSSGLPEFGEGWKTDVEVIEAVVAGLAGLIPRFRERISQTDRTDLVTQDLLIELTGKVEETHWMWQAQLAG